MKRAVACICVGDKYNLTDVKILEQMVLYQNKIHKTNKKILISGNSEIFNIDIRK